MMRSPVEPRPEATNTDARLEAFEERAAILEFDAGLTRTEAERRARAAYGLAPDPNHSRHSDRRTRR